MNNIDYYFETSREKEPSALISLVGTKSDLKRIFSTEQGHRMAAALDVLYFECSAKTGVNIEEMFEEIVSQLPEKVDKMRGLEAYKVRGLEVE